jgi:hypothetical protein
MGDMRMIAAVALLLVEDLEEHPKQSVSPLAKIGLAVDVEQDGVGIRGYDPLQIREEHGIGDFIGEKLDRSPSLPLVDVLLVLQQVGEHLDKMGLSATEEAGDPDPILACRVCLGLYC